MKTQKVVRIGATGVLVLGLALLWAGGAFADRANAGWASGEFEGTREEVESLIGYNTSIQLDAAQEAIMDKALEGLPAPCCSKYSAATCCCECNFARSTWGLAKYLITEHGAGVGEVRKAARAWIEVLYPSGYSGQACFQGRCNRAFSDDGCGGMSANRVIFEP